MNSKTEKVAGKILFSDRYISDFNAQQFISGTSVDVRS
jgi:exopolysaccharide biosynthesis protein